MVGISSRQNNWFTFFTCAGPFWPILVTGFVKLPLILFDIELALITFFEDIFVTVCLPKTGPWVLQTENIGH